MEIPIIQVEDIIIIGIGYVGPRAQIVRIYTNEEKKGGLCGDAEVVYHQNCTKGVKEDVIWNGENWQFKIEGPCGFPVDINQFPKVKCS